MASEEVLKVVFCLLEGTDLASCMLVCTNWRGVAQDDYFWRCLCAKKWPSIVTRPMPPSTTYRMLYKACYRRRPYKTRAQSIKGYYPWKCQDLLPPRLSFEDLDFYIDISLGNQLIFSEVIPGAVMKAGIDTSSGKLRFRLTDPRCITATLPVESKWDSLRVSILVERNDYKKIACIISRATFYQIDECSFAFGDDALNFSPSNPFISETRAGIFLAFYEDDENEGFVNISQIEMDFAEEVESEKEFLWLLDMLDWK